MRVYERNMYNEMQILDVGVASESTHHHWTMVVQVAEP